jgi:hypothetical protein
MVESPFNSVRLRTNAVMRFKKILKCHSQDLKTTHDCEAVIRPAADLWQHYMQFCRKLLSVSTF